MSIKLVNFEIENYSVSYFKSSKMDFSSKTKANGFGLENESDRHNPRT